MDSIRFTITQEMVDRFATLVGDRSSLHVDAAFARRSPYRRCVVHGMLPVMFLGRSGLLVDGRSRYGITQLSAQFIKPAYPGDRLALSWSERSDDTGEGEKSAGRFFEYRITKGAVEEPVTRGALRLSPISLSQPEVLTAVENDGEAPSIITQPLQERAVCFEDLSKGEEAHFPIRITPGHLGTLDALLRLGTNGEDAGDESTTYLTKNLLYAACSSAYVGMKMPGRNATFTEFSSDWSEPVELGQPATYRGKVTFLSPSTQTAVAQFEVKASDRDGPIGTGKIKVRVNDPPASMPTMTQIAKDAHLGLQDRVVLVTGASRGIGETIAKLFGAYGARVVVNYFRGEEDAERIVGEIVDAGGTALKAQADVSDSASVARLLELTVNTFGPVEILVNNAVGDYEAALFQELTWSDVQRDLDIILKGAFNCCQAVLPSMVDHGFGRIVNLSTVAVENPPAHHARYVIAKSALLGLTRSLAVEYAAHGICVNAVMPGLVETDLTSNLSHLVRDMMQKATPMQRHASPLDVARAVVFLGSDWAGYTTGQQIAVTGGQPPFH